MHGNSAGFQLFRITIGSISGFAPIMSTHCKARTLSMYNVKQDRARNDSNHDHLSSSDALASPRERQ